MHAHAQLESSVLPTSQQEMWRYSRIDELELDRFHPVIRSQSPSGSLSGAAADLADAIGLRSALVATWNGVVSRIDIEPEAKGLRAAASDSWLDGADLKSPDGDDYFNLLNSAFAADPVVIDVPAGAVLDHPVVIIHWVNQHHVAAFPRVLVRAGEGSEATVVECFVSDAVEALVVPTTELELAPSSNLRYVSVQLLSEQVWQIGTQQSRVDRDATLTSTTVALGGEYARVATASHLVGKGATSRLNAAYFGSRAQVHDFRTLQLHDAPKTTSDLLFKGALGGNSRSVYSGLIHVKRGASGTNAFQTNRNLVLSPGSHADSVPNLEIEENDVKCSHASAVGPIDEDQRYYLESRGVPSDVAERLIALGFLDELLEKVEIEGLRQLLRDVVARKLNDLDEAA